MMSSTLIPLTMVWELGIMELAVKRSTCTIDSSISEM